MGRKADWKWHENGQKQGKNARNLTLGQKRVICRLLIRSGLRRDVHQMWCDQVGEGSCRAEGVSIIYLPGGPQTPSDESVMALEHRKCGVGKVHQRDCLWSAPSDWAHPWVTIEADNPLGTPKKRSQFSSVSALALKSTVEIPDCGQCWISRIRDFQALSNR